MPTRPFVPNVCKVEFLWTQNGIPAANVRYLLYSGGPPAAGDCAAIAHDISSPFISGMMPGYPASTIFEACRVMDLASATGAEGTYTAAAPGTDSAEALPANCAILVNQTIARRYRGGHPRQYYPAPSIDSMATPSSWNSSLVANVGAAEAAFAAACTGPSYGSTDLIYVVNVSYVSGGAPRVVPVVDQITGHVVSGIVRTQRRRVTASSY